MISTDNSKFSFRLNSLSETFHEVNKLNSEKPHKVPVSGSKLLKKAKTFYHLSFTYTFIKTSTMHYQVALFQMHWNMLMSDRRLKRLTNLMKKKTKLKSHQDPPKSK